MTFLPPLHADRTNLNRLGGAALFATAVVLVLLSTLCPSSGFASSPPVAAYSFDEGEGEVAEDLAGEHDGTLKSTEWVKGKYGSAIFLDGNNDYVEILDSPELQLTEEFTLEAWVRPDGFDNEGVVISKQAGSDYSYQLYGASREEGGVPEGFLGYDTEPFAWEDVEDDENPLQPKIWNHLALTFDGADLRLYVNGELVDTEFSPPALASEGPLMIGGNDDDEDFQGRIDEVRLYDRALTSEEAADITRPTFANGFAALSFPETTETRIWFSEAFDLSSFSGAPLKVPYYTYRYAIGTEPSTPWSTSSDNSFSVPTAEKEASIAIEVFANDAAGNRSPVESVTISIDGEAPELTEKELEEAEDADRADNGPAQLLRFRSDPNSEEEEPGLFATPTGFRCAYKADQPHISEHEKPLLIINAVSWIECNVPGATGWIATSLMRVGPYGSYPVKTSGNSPIVNSLKRTYARAPINCSPGKFYTLGSFRVIPPPKFKVLGPSYRTYASKTRTIHC